MQIDDTEREGDGERMMRNWKMLMLYNRSRGRGTKCAFEAMRLITTVELFTPQRWPTELSTVCLSIQKGVKAIIIQMI